MKRAILPILVVLSFQCRADDFAQKEGIREFKPAHYDESALLANFRAVNVKMYHGIGDFSKPLVAADGEVSGKLVKALQQDSKPAKKAELFMTGAVAWIAFEALDGSAKMARLEIHSGLILIFDGEIKNQTVAIDWKKRPTVWICRPFVGIVTQELKSKAPEYWRKLDDMMKEVSGRGVEMFLDEPVTYRE